MSCAGRVRGNISQLRVSGNLVTLAVLGTLCESGYINPLNPSYVYYDDGTTWFRKGVRDGAFVLDIRLTADPGWDGEEDTDWKCLRSIILEGTADDIYWASRYPFAFTATGGAEKIDLAWTNNGTTTYTGVSIERSEDDITYAEIDTASAGDTTYSDTTVVVDTLYYYRIRYYKE